MDRENVIREYENFVNSYVSLVTSEDYEFEMHKAVLALLKDQESQLFINREEGFHEGYGLALSELNCKRFSKSDKERNETRMENEKKQEAKLASPWVQYVNALKALFKNDPEVAVNYDEENNLLLVKVDNPAKAEALAELLPSVKRFGNVNLWVNVVPSNVRKTKTELFRNALEGNPAFRDLIPVEGAFSNPMLYVLFKKEVVQYFNDDLGDPHGNRSTLYQDIAREVFKDLDGVFYCTDNMVD